MRGAAGRDRTRVTVLGNFRGNGAPARG